MSTRHQLRNAALLAPLLALYWVFGFYPFNWEMPLQTIDNGLSESGQELIFERPGIVFSREEPAWLGTAIAQATLSISLSVRSAGGWQSGPARIFTVSRDTHRRNLTIGQEGTDLVIRLRTPDTNPNGLPPYRINGVFAEPGWRRIDLHIVPKQLRVDIDGRKILSAALPRNALSAWSRGYRLALGNEFSYDRPWIGTIRRADVIVEGRITSYVNGETLTAPAQLSYCRANYIIKPFVGKSISSAYLSDFFINLLGFIPVGVLLMATGKGRLSLLSITIMAACLSLSIELGQLFLPGRVTETEDFILNTLGALLGGWLFSKYADKRYAPLR